jgi:hypothetical protein
MKRINLESETILPSGERISSLSVLRLVTGNSPNKNLSVEDIRKRVHILDALDSAAGDVLLLEDENYKCLCDALNGFPWGTAHKTLLTIIDSVLKAETVPAAKLVEKGGKN